jgi:hypothetical protein
MIKNKAKRRFGMTLLEVSTLIDTNQPELDELQAHTDKLLELDINKISSPVLARLIEEVRNEEKLNAHAYNRMHNRHNRSR